MTEEYETQDFVDFLIWTSGFQFAVFVATLLGCQANKVSSLKGTSAINLHIGKLRPSLRWLAQSYLQLFKISDADPPDKLMLIPQIGGH